MSAWITAILGAITSAFTTLGTAIFTFLKDGFIELFTEYTVTESTGAKTITGASPLAYFAFALMGITLVLSLSKYVTSLIRAKRSM